MSEMNPGYIDPLDPWGGERKRTPKKVSDADARRLALESIEKLQQFVAEIDAKHATPPEPEPGAYSVILRYGNAAAAAKSYEYVFLRTSGARGWYSTAQISSGHFDSWEALWRWMNRKQVVWRSEFRRMDYGSVVVPASDAS